MHKVRAQTIWIGIGTFLFLLLITYSANKIYRIALDETKRNHQLLQKDMANAAANGISHYLSHIAHDLLAVNSFQQSPLIDQSVFINFIDNLSDHAMMDGVRAIFYSDVGGNVLHTTNDSLNSIITAMFNDRVDWKRNFTDSANIWFSGVMPIDVNGRDSDLYFMVVTPLVHRDAKLNTETGKVTGFLGEIVCLRWLIDSYIRSVNPGDTGAAWLIDGAGRLLFHPDHPEMILRDVYEISDDCMTCHTTFAVQRGMIAEDSPFGEYAVGNEPIKIVSYVPIQIANLRWIIVVSSNMNDVTAVIRNKFHLFSILIALLLIATTIIGLLLYLINTRRIRAEEAQRHSELKELLHQQICQAAKMASIGELVDTVAHEINTPISIIGAQADAMILNHKNGDSEELRIIKDQSRRIRDYTRRLLNHSQMMPFRPRSIDITRIIDETIYLLGHRFRVYKIDVQKNYARDLPNLSVDRRQLEQVIINLLNNAVDAIGNNGQIRIDVKKNDDEEVELSISDSGVGISNENMLRIFEPFFTTKSPSTGTGLGLSISKAIVIRHGGKITVESTNGQGTTFNITLPSTKSQVHEK
ncbi:ATP-binding protein [candidate division KSB1 bacterium]|nr:ATP-binding protein [candidate division KSB1 bacterium]